MIPVDHRPELEERECCRVFSREETPSLGPKGTISPFRVGPAWLCEYSGLVSETQ